MFQHGYTLSSLGRAVGGYQTAVVARVVKGDMKIPINKIVIFAKVLRVSPLRLFKMVYPELIDNLREIFGSYPLSDNEKAIIETVRRVSGSNDAHPETVEELNSFEQMVLSWSNRQQSDEKGYEDLRDQYKLDRNYPDYKKLYAKDKPTEDKG